MVFVLLICVVLLWAWVGKRRGKNQIVWGLAGLGVAISIVLIGILPVLWVDDPMKGLLIWVIAEITSFTVSTVLAIMLFPKRKAVA